MVTRSLLIDGLRKESRCQTNRLKCNVSAANAKTSNIKMIISFFGSHPQPWPDLKLPVALHTHTTIVNSNCPISDTTVLVNEDSVARESVRNTLCRDGTSSTLCTEHLTTQDIGGAFTNKVITLPLKNIRSPSECTTISTLTDIDSLQRHHVNKSNVFFVHQHCCI